MSSDSDAEARKNFGERMRYLRGYRKMTQEQVAELIESSVNLVSTIEKGDSSPSFKRLIKLAEALDVDMDELFRFDDSLPKRRWRKER